MRGADKLLEKIDGEPLLRRQAQAAKANAEKVLVALPPDSQARRAALTGTGATPIHVATAAAGMGESIGAGVSALPEEIAGVALLPADMPDISADDLGAVLRAFTRNPDRVARGTSADGRHGHPVVFPARLFPALRKLKGDSGARSLLECEKPRLVQLPGEHALTDLDTPEDWAIWRASRYD